MSVRFGTLMNRADDILIQGLDAIFLVLANLRERLDDSPESKNIVLHLLSIDAHRSDSAIATCHFFDVHLKFAYVLADNFRINNFFGGLSMRSGGESNWKDINIQTKGMNI